MSNLDIVSKALPTATHGGRATRGSRSVSQVVRALRFFSSSGDHVWALLRQQAELVHAGTVALAAVMTTSTSAEEARAAIDRSDADAERCLVAVESALRGTLMVPIDREDMHELAFALNRLLALGNRARRTFVLLAIEPSAERKKPLAALLVGCALKIDEAVRTLSRRDYSAVIEVLRELRTLQADAELAHDEALSSLIGVDASVPDNVLLRRKTGLDDLDAAIRQCSAVGKLLTYLAVKNG